MRLRAERVADVSRGEYRELTRLSFVEYAAQWIASYAGHGKAKALTEDELLAFSRRSRACQAETEDVS